jgi:hypothetical protein
MKPPARLWLSAVLGTVMLYGTGCASIVHSGDRPVMLDSDPQGAFVTIANREGEVVASVRTPCIVRLDPRGGYFQGQEYVATFSLDGYAGSQALIYPKLSPWYFGNVVFGLSSLIGFVVVDPLTGCMWNLRPLHIEQALERLPGLPAAPSGTAAPSAAPIPTTESPPLSSTPPDSTNAPALPAPDGTNRSAQPPPSGP